MASGERTGTVSCLLASNHPFPKETQPREWRRTPIGQTRGGGVCSCGVVAATRLQARLRTGAAAKSRREKFEKKEKGGHKGISLDRKNILAEFINRDPGFKFSFSS